ncbi:glucuronate isomerase [Allorhodopirellula solitaria]|uniref:Glucuronate isomerase n=1 Tax=Allorhodopirellula solitaria TaxID=2527987 RepID=A0A5C5YIS9_9BACT|nr:glucuronate isomerase [Allorhodopirellula solitaria]TWT74773.1 glucuronate isomerase [Allorhodopirellula solitaria]
MIETDMPDAFSQPGSARTDIYQELASLRLTDPHTHINPHAPASTTLADLLGYHYYTELAHSAGMPKAQIEGGSIAPKELVERLVGRLSPLENTVQYSWLIEICQMFFGFEDDRLHAGNWERLYDHSESVMSSAQWPDMVLDQSNVEAVFLTNDFDDDLAGFDSDRYIPCLRTDDLVFHLADKNVRERLAACTGIELDGSLQSLRASLRALFEHFVSRGARACAISLPPSFTPTSVPDGRAQTALDAVLRGGLTSDESHRDALSRRVFWTLAELCDEFQLPFDLMIGVNRKVYPAGVFQGQDLFDSRVSLIQYRDLFNTFPDVTFPVSVLASVTNQELVSYAWIFPNVIPNGHWWYSNTPSTISHDLAARLEAVPQTKMIGYYSDAYKLEFVWPKFNMYRKVLAGVLADQFVGDRGWSIQRAVDLGRTVLQSNTDAIFPKRTAAAPQPADSSASAVQTHPVDTPVETISLADENVSQERYDEAVGDEQISELENESRGFSDDVEGDAAPTATAVDPLPVDDEIEELGLDDVELVDPTKEPTLDSDSIALGLDEEILDVGDLTLEGDGDENLPSDQQTPHIEQLRGETSFSPDDDSLQLKSDPLTGEFRFDSGEDSSDEKIETTGKSSDSDKSQPEDAEAADFSLDWLEEDNDSEKK